MTEKRSVRPPVAPKPSFIQHNAATNTPTHSPASSPALRGAASAFGPGLLKPVNASAIQTPSAGALAAATAVGKRQAAQLLQEHSGSSASAGPRGRALTAESLPVSVSSQPSSVSPPKPGFLPHSPRSTSAVAAVAASARTSPVRPEIKRDKTGSYQSKTESLMGARQRGMSTSSTHELQQPQPRNHNAVAGATASMAAVASQLAAQRTGDRQRQDLGSIAHANLQPSHPSTVSTPSPSGTAAAALATRNAAAFELARKNFSLSGEQSHTGTPPKDSSLPQSATVSANWPNIKVTPPHTDTESEAAQSAPEHIRKPMPAPVPLRPARAAMIAQEKASHNNSSQSPARDSRAKMSVNALADAMVAGSVASSHAPSRMHSPAVKPPPPKPRRRSKSVGLFDGGRHLKSTFGLNNGSETPKLEPPPARSMRHTLRHTSPDHDDKDEGPAKRGRRHWRRHPNMHHEGDRKRWRDKVTERERKRYEGVWAGNRGVLVDYDLEYLELEGANDLVVNVVVKDIWERSRLPHDVLEEVWDLVAPANAKALNREEFVVGLWLIDQRLKGRKLPIKVSASVWSSVRRIHGVKISSKPIPK